MSKPGTPIFDQLMAEMIAVMQDPETAKPPAIVKPPDVEEKACSAEHYVHSEHNWPYGPEGPWYYCPGAPVLDADHAQQGGDNGSP